MNTGIVAAILVAAIAGSDLAAAAAGHDHRQDGSTLVRVVRESTRHFQDVSVALSSGYTSMGSCVSSPQDGAMGIHYPNGALIGDGVLDAARPEILIYEQRNGLLRLVGVEYLVLAAQWDAANAGPPILMGQHFHYVGSPNRYRLPPFYELHVWAWRDNPNGTFADWNPRVSCDEYAGETTVTTGGHGGGH